MKAEEESRTYKINVTQSFDMSESVYDGIYCIIVILGKINAVGKLI